MARPRHFIDLTGLRFGRLFVTAYHGMLPGSHDAWLCTCDCGQIKIIRGTNLRHSQSISCGCWYKEQRRVIRRTHGMTYTLTYRTWTSMKRRCQNPNTLNYSRYGGRGITVCDRWQKFENFWADMGEQPKGVTLERRNNDRSYSPENCRWATSLEQARNKRNTLTVLHDGTTLTLRQWADKLGISYHTLYFRFVRNWPTGRMLAAQVRR